ncbi:MAG: hypothetical protein KKD00_12590 [Gammaproteobacteria bacterium]|nr:hypothetical protein [Gammaproteobacteria bacterium]
MMFQFKQDWHEYKAGQLVSADRLSENQLSNLLMINVLVDLDAEKPKKEKAKSDSKAKPEK